MAFCVACVHAKVTEPRVPFVAADAEYVRNNGNNTLDITAYLKLLDGEIIRCNRGYSIELWPVTDFSRSLVADLIGSENGGDFYYRNSYQRPHVGSSADYKHFREYVKKIDCNKDSHAIFTEISDGEYYVFTDIYWYWATGYGRFSEVTYYGAVMFDRVKVSGGQTLNHTMTRDKPIQ
jgi:hypothetical protein